MNSWLYVTVLSVVQGLTEFLPVSSSGHLAVLGELFGLSEDRSMSLGIVLHAGSLCAIVAFYRKTLLSFFSFSRERIRLAGLILLASVPAGIAGVALKMSGLGELLFGNLLAIGICFWITATVLRMSGKSKLIFRGRHAAPDAPPVPLEKIGVRESLTVGFAQMIAILPGVSRSGSTIAAGILSNVERESAAAFSFLLAIVAIGGAAGLEVLSMIRKGAVGDGELGVVQLIFGFLLSAAVSFGALTFLVKLIRGGKLIYFAWYLYGIGAAVVIWQIAVRI